LCKRLKNTAGGKNQQNPAVKTNCYFANPIDAVISVNFYIILYGKRPKYYNKKLEFLENNLK
jgi:hypothetical protein